MEKNVNVLMDLLDMEQHVGNVQLDLYLMLIELHVYALMQIKYLLLINLYVHHVKEIQYQVLIKLYVYARLDSLLKMEYVYPIVKILKLLMLKEVDVNVNQDGLKD